MASDPMMKILGLSNKHGVAYGTYKDATRGMIDPVILWNYDILHAS